MKRFKTNFPQLYFLLFAFIVSGVALFFLYSCSDAKQQQKGWDKFVKHGGKIEPITKTITVTDTIKGADGKDSIIYRTIECVCPEPIILTRWQTRYIYKAYKDSLKHERIKFKQGSKNAVRMARNDTKRTKIDNKHDLKVTKVEKRSGWKLWIIIVVLLGMIIISMKYFKTNEDAN